MPGEQYYVDLYRMVLLLVDGEWSEVPSSYRYNDTLIL